MRYIKGCIISVLLLFFINCSENYRVTYLVTGDAPSVTITSSTITPPDTRIADAPSSVTSSEIIVTDLPWWDENHNESGGYNSDGVSYKTVSISARNNTSEDSTLTAAIYVNGELKASKTSRGPFCSVYTDTKLE